MRSKETQGHQIIINGQEIMPSIDSRLHFVVRILAPAGICVDLEKSACMVRVPCFVPVLGGRTRQWYRDSSSTLGPRLLTCHPFALLMPLPTAV